MDRNCGPGDRVARIMFALTLALFVFVGALEGAAAIVGAMIAAYLLVSGLLARCLFYKLADIETTSNEQPYSTTDDRAGL
jgi:hypothetical protein